MDAACTIHSTEPGAVGAKVWCGGGEGGADSGARFLPLFIRMPIRVCAGVFNAMLAMVSLLFVRFSLFLLCFFAFFFLLHLALTVRSRVRLPYSI